jgi:hypothetical protein
MLPGVHIDFANGALGKVAQSADNVCGILTTGVAVLAGEGISGFALKTTYVLTKFDDLAALGITEANNPGIVDLISDFYNQCGDGVTVYLKAFANTVTMTEMITRTTEDGIEEMLRRAQGQIRMIFVHRTPAEAYEADVEGGIDTDAQEAAAAAQVTCDWAESTLKAPCMAIIAGLFYTGDPADLTDMSESTLNRVGIMIGSNHEDGLCSIGLLAGRLAAIPVQRNIGRVKDGAIAGITKAYYGGSDTPVGDTDPTMIHDKGYITLRTIIGRSGIFFVDDPLCAPDTDDYNHITARRTVDKAYRIAYDTLINELLDEIPVTAEGKITPAFAKGLENKVESAIVNSMTANNNLGNDPTDAKDTGVKCFCDYDQNIVATGQLKITLKVKPYGYARYIEVTLGFQTLTA